MRILLVEDNEANRLVARLILEREGHIVIHAENGRIAIEQSIGIKFDLILMDIMMPVMDGIKTLGRLRRLASHNQDTPVIALTAYCSPFDRKHYQHIGFDHVLVKPLKIGDIASTMKTLSLPLQDRPIPATALAPSPPERKPAVTQYWKDIKQAIHIMAVHFSGAIENDKGALEQFRQGGRKLALTANQAGFARLAVKAQQIETASYNILTTLMPALLKTLDSVLLQLTQQHITNSSLADHSCGEDGQTKSTQILTSPLLSLSPHMKSEAEARPRLGQAP